MSDASVDRPPHPFILAEVVSVEGNTFLQVGLPADLTPKDRRSYVDSQITTKLKDARALEIARACDLLIGTHQNETTNKAAIRRLSQEEIERKLDKILSGLAEEFGEKWIYSRRRRASSSTEEKSSPGAGALKTALRRASEVVDTFSPFHNMHAFSKYTQKIAAPLALKEIKAALSSAERMGGSETAYAREQLIEQLTHTLRALSVAIARMEEFEDAAAEVADAIARGENPQDYADIVAGEILHPGIGYAYNIAFHADVNPAKIWVDRSEMLVHGIRAIEFYEAIKS